MRRPFPWSCGVGWGRIERLEGVQTHAQRTPPVCALFRSVPPAAAFETGMARTGPNSIWANQSARTYDGHLRNTQAPPKFLKEQNK